MVIRLQLQVQVSSAYLSVKDLSERLWYPARPRPSRSVVAENWRQYRLLRVKSKLKIVGNGFTSRLASVSGIPSIKSTRALTSSVRLHRTALTQVMNVKAVPSSVARGTSSERVQGTTVAWKLRIRIMCGRDPSLSGLRHSGGRAHETETLRLSDYCILTEIYFTPQDESSQARAVVSASGILRMGF